MGRRLPQSIKADRQLLLKMLGELRAGRLRNFAVDDVDLLISQIERRLEGLESEPRMARRRHTSDRG